MNNDDQITILQSHFDSIVCTDVETSVEFWYARDLQPYLGYKEWRNFETAIDRAKQSCKASGFQCSDHFVGVNKMIVVGKGAQREVSDYKLTRYACYLIAQNGDPSKKEIAFAQCYFAVQTRRQELIQDRMNLLTRLEAREKLKESEKRLSQNIYERGVDVLALDESEPKETKLYLGEKQQVI